MATGRRGRPYLVPEDPSPLGHTAVDVNARVGWLMLMSRLHHVDPEHSQGEAFNAGLRAVGLQADRSAVSRWESGKVTPRYSVLVAYERVLNLRPGQLTSVVNAQRRAFAGSGLPAWMPVLDPTSTAFHAELNSILDALLDGDTSGPQWIGLAHHVTAADSVFVQRRVWKSLAGTLVDQMSRSVGVAYLQRFEATRLLLEDPAARSSLVGVTTDYLTDPAVQIVNDPMALLDISRSPEAAHAVLRLFTHTRSALVRRAAAPVLSAKLARGAYSPETLEDLEEELAAALGELGPSVQVTGIIQTLPQKLRSRLTEELAPGAGGPDESPATSLVEGQLSAAAAMEVSGRLYEGVRERLPATSLYDADKMTPRLIAEALFAPQHLLNHYASLALLGSPFRAALADLLVEEVDSCRADDPRCGDYARVLRYLAAPKHEERLLGWLPAAPPPVARDLALTIGHLPSDRPLHLLLSLLDGERPALDRALLYGLGMRRAPELATLASDSIWPEPHRDAAQWWLRQGGAVFT